MPFRAPGPARTGGAIRAEAPVSQTALPLEALGVTMAVAKSEMIFAEGDSATRYFRVVDGVVRCFKLTMDGRRQITRFCMPGDFFGWSSHGAHSYSAEAIADGLVANYQRADVEALVNTSAEARRAVLNKLREECEHAQDHMLMLGRMSALERVASFLLMLRERASGSATPQSVIRVPMSREDIGDYLGLTIESVSRVFSELRRRGVISLEQQHRVTIVQPDALQELAGSA
jgi:CRP-like cAMP-binding protein